MLRVALAALGVAGVAVSVVWYSGARAEERLHSIELSAASGPGARVTQAQTRELANRATELRPNVQVLVSEGVIAVRRRRWEQARAFFAEAARREPTSLAPWVGLLVVARQTGSGSERRLQRKILEIDPWQDRRAGL